MAVWGGVECEKGGGGFRVRSTSISESQYFASFVIGIQSAVGVLMSK